MEKNPSKILQQHNIEIVLDDPRTAEQVLMDMVARGLVTMANETNEETL